MRKANAALPELSSPCPFAPFGTVIVNHTATSPEFPHGQLICYSVNQNIQEGNPTLHGEISGINNCTKILTDPSGPYKLTPKAALSAFHQLTLYTNAEPCPMCASAIRWSGFKECVFGTSIGHLIEKGWSQITLSSSDVFSEAGALPGATRLLGGVLRNETDAWFEWQFDEGVRCPRGCERKGGKGLCEPVEEEGRGRSEL
ncbi:cytidine deaminase-like protein [Mollisia scopiformis]|uniref:Cytidine deaminase-like protein n=1 Tax=Mollisia scopiformis TaxID=149040 RepID=A0A194XII7_MOLSC|nr:cytidine deaminase-like protein [Mollisia scopiformis]KUJ19934.1 cytidine deaminase-like protein [Mollisia scopiformis]